MAAIGQGQTGGEGTVQAQQSQGEGQGQQGPDLTSLAEQVGGLSGSMEEMRQILQTLTPQEQAAVEQAQQEGGDDFDLSFLDDPTLDQQTASTRLNDVINGAIEQRIQAATQPVIERQNEMRINQEARDLAERFPELQDEAAAKALAGPGGLVEQALRQADPNVAKMLGGEPWFWGLVHMANKSAEQANNEGSGDPGAAHLESGGGAGPTPTPEDLVKGIMNAGNGLGARVLDF